MAIKWLKKTGGSKRGFTLIELLVVIAIIGILSSVVLASLNSARNKGQDAKTKAQLSAARAAAEVYYDNNGSSYANMCSVASSDTSGVYTYLQAANWPANAAPTCNQSATAYALQQSLTTAGAYWCVDSTGKSKAEGAVLGAATACP